MRTRRPSAIAAPRAPLPWPVVIASVLVLASALVAGCGFQLRGTQQLSPALNPIAIETVRVGSALLPPLRAALVAAGAELADDPATARSHLRILGDAFGQRVIAMTPQGQPREAELSYTVAYELLDADGEVLQRRELVHRIEFAIDEREILAKTHEAEVLNAALVDEMVASVVRHLATVGR